MDVATAQLQPVERITITVVGDGAVGKTSLLLAYVSGAPPAKHVPTVFDVVSVHCQVDRGDVIALVLQDTAGQEEYDRLRALAYPGTDVFLCAYALDSPVSRANVRAKWLPELAHHAPAAPIVLVGTKADLAPPAAPAPEPRCAAHLACSAHDAAAVKRAFDECVRAALAARRKRAIDDAAPRRKRRPQCALL